MVLLTASLPTYDCLVCFNPGASSVVKQHLSLSMTKILKHHKVQEFAANRSANPLRGCEDIRDLVFTGQSKSKSLLHTCCSGALCWNNHLFGFWIPPGEGKEPLPSAICCHFFILHFSSLIYFVFCWVSRKSRSTTFNFLSFLQWCLCWNLFFSLPL